MSNWSHVSGIYLKSSNLWLSLDAFDIVDKKRESWMSLRALSQLLTLFLFYLSDCSRQCWCFGSNGLQALGQRELVFLVECLPEEKALPKDLFTLYLNIYQEAQKGRRHIRAICFSLYSPVWTKGEAKSHCLLLQGSFWRSWIM